MARSHRNTTAATHARKLLILLTTIGLIVFMASVAGRLLIVDRPVKSDLIVILGGDTGDVRLKHAIDLLNEGYAKDVVIDGPDWLTYGHPMYDYANEFALSLPSSIKSRVHVCPFDGDSTQLELQEVAPCLERISPAAKTGLVVTSTYHTRRALSVARKVLPQYSWSAAAASDPRFGTQWWRHREWAKTCLTEWQKMAWWQLLERWKAR